MAQFISIHTTPPALSIHVQPGKLEYQRGSAQMHISREKGGLSIKRKAPLLKLDTFDARNSMFPTAASSLRDYAQKGKQAAQEATATYAQQGKRAMECPLGDEMITEFAREAIFKDVKLNVGLDFFPKGGVKMSCEPGYTEIHYEADRMRIDWQIQQARFNYTQADVDIQVARKPDIQIDYLADPILVPKSANDNPYINVRA